MALALEAIRFTLIALEAVVVLILLGLIIDTFAGFHEKLEEVRTDGAKTKEALLELMRKEQVRRQKETEAHAGFFEDDYKPGFDATGAIFHRPIKVPTEKALEYYRQMDELADTQIFENTKEI